MDLQLFVKRWLVTFVVFMGVDLIWLGIIAQPIYDHFIGEFLADSPNWAGAIAFYTLFVVGIVHYAVNPGLKQKSAIVSAQNGALFGFFTYMTYELTNFAVLEGWPLGIVFIDIAWGVVLGSATAYLSWMALSRRL